MRYPYPVLQFENCLGPLGKASPHNVNTPMYKVPGTHRMTCWWYWEAQDEARRGHVVVCAHGLTRQGRDFDVLAARLSEHACVLCPDAAGRGASDWLQTPEDYNIYTYAADMVAMLYARHQYVPITTLDWVGTSMGGLIGMVLAGHPNLPLPLPAPIRALVLNDVGPVVEWAALQRIGSYLGKNMHFADEQQAAAALRAISQGFGPHSDAEWLALTRPMLRRAAGGGVVLHYDPQIAVPFAQTTPQAAQADAERMFQFYDNIRARTLLVRGADSDLLSRATAQAMAEFGPRPHCVEFAGVGHAPTFVAPGQVELLRRFLFSDAPLPHTLTLAEQAGAEAA